MEDLVMSKLAQFYQGKTVLLTGHTGFKGAWMCLWLESLGARVAGCSLEPESQPSLHGIIGTNASAGHFIADIRDAGRMEEIVHTVKPDIIFHLAAQALVRRSYAQPLQTLETNLMGTLNLLEAVRKTDLSAPVIVVTTDKCYENHGWNYGYRESDPLGGHDVYSMSKAACELAVASWRRSFFETNAGLGPVATARAGNVIGGGDYAEDRILPDCVRAAQARVPLVVRNPQATRPWQHVLDCLSGYLWLGIRLAEQGPRSDMATAFNFGPPLQSNVPVKRVVEEFSKHWAMEWLDTSDPKAPHEASRLHLSIDKAAALLGWHPTWSFERVMEQTVLWYHQFHSAGGAPMKDFSLAQIRQFSLDAASAAAPWA